jgi:hypothetical protein
MSENVEPIEAKLVLNPELVEAVAEFEHAQLNHIAKTLIEKGVDLDDYLVKIAAPYSELSDELKHEAREWARAVGKIFLGALLVGKIEPAPAPTLASSSTPEDIMLRNQDLVHENQKLQQELKNEKSLRQFAEFKAQCYSHDCWKVTLERDEARQEICHNAIKDVPFDFGVTDLLENAAKERGWLDLFNTELSEKGSQIFKERELQLAENFAALQVLKAESFLRVLKYLHKLKDSNINTHVSSLLAAIDDWRGKGGKLYGE